MARFPDAIFMVIAGAFYSAAVRGLPAEFPGLGLRIGQLLRFLKKGKSFAI